MKSAKPKPKPKETSNASTPSAPGRSTGPQVKNIPVAPDVRKPPQMESAQSGNEKKKTLFIGDSISANVDIAALENATQSKFVTARAYSSANDSEGNAAKHPAKFPQSSFINVVQSQLSKDKYETLVLQAGTVDITNFKTQDNPTEHFEYFKQETAKSATNLFQVAINALSSSPNLKKVVLMKQIPRYDPSSHIDPMCLKPALSQLFNNTLSDLWMNSQYQGRIMIGNHNIECSGAIKEARYRETKSGRYDGIHLYGSSGRKAYTLSVLNILRCAQVTSSDYDYHQSCAHYKYQQRESNFRHQGGYRQSGFKRNNKRNRSYSKTEFVVHTQNRFGKLSEHNQENC